MFGKDKQLKYFNGISSLLSGLGVRQGAQKMMYDPNRLVASLSAKSGRRYEINFQIEDDEVIYEAVVKKAISGNPEKSVHVYQALLGYNTTNSKINFALVESGSTWIIILKGAQKYKHVDAEYLLEIIEHYDLAFSFHVDRIERAVRELGLEFSGKLDKSIRGLIEGIVESD